MSELAPREAMEDATLRQIRNRQKDRDIDAARAAWAGWIAALALATFMVAAAVAVAGAEPAWRTAPWWRDLTIALGLTYAIIVGHFAMRPLVAATLVRSDRLSIEPDDGPSVLRLAGPLGMVERALYFAAFAIGIPLFAGVWLALKFLGAADLRISQAERSPKPGRDRRLFQRSLILAGVSLAYAAAGWRYVRWATIPRHGTPPARWPHVASGGLLVALVLATAALAIYIARLHPEPQPDPQSERAAGVG